MVFSKSAIFNDKTLIKFIQIIFISKFIHMNSKGKKKLLILLKL
jgi:hypothetical protein